MKRVLKIFLVLIIFCWVGCKERFDPGVPASQSNYLVVEGFINARGFTAIKLSRTVPLNDPAVTKHESRAQVTIAGEDNSEFRTREGVTGTYLSDSLTLNANQKYRLRIKTASGGEYLSEFVAVKQTPAIDSVHWRPEKNGIQFYVNTHDSQKNTRFYKWDFEETWEIHSAYENSYKYINGAVVSRDYSEILKLYYCWKTQTSSNIFIGTSAQLTTDVINLAPITFIPIESERISVRYSIQVTQYSLDARSYQFYSLMKSNTESLGSIFDPLPSELTGNIVCVSNPLERVVGFVTASTIDRKRIFVSAAQVQSRYSPVCETTYVPNNADSLKHYLGSMGLSPYGADGTPPGPVKGYYATAPVCVDCTLRGTNVKPSFW
jgi:hypothetical protein